MGARAQEEAPRGPSAPSLVRRRGWSGVTRRHHQGCPPVSTAEWVRILPLDAGTCTCGNVLPVDPRQRGDHLHIHVQDPLLQPLSAAHAPQLGYPAMLEASPTGTLRGYIDRHLRAAALISRQRMTRPPTATSNQGSLARRRGGSRHYLSHGEASTELVPWGPAIHTRKPPSVHAAFH
jgi:hypothetical protein